MRYLVFLIIVSFSSRIHGQELFFGDSTIERSIKKITSEIYETRDRTNFLLTSQKFQTNAVSGTNIVAHSKDDAVNRIVTSSFTSEGQLSAEWYYDNEQLIFCYQVFEYFAENQPKGAWKNFKGLASWESRYYFENDQLRYHKHKGRKNIEQSALEGQLLYQARKILSYAKEQLE